MATKPTILVVNDSILVLSWVKFALQVEFEVHTRSEAIGTGAAVLRLRPQMVLIDAEMPVLAGEEVVRGIKQSAAGRGVSVVLFSALPIAELQARAAGCGADGYVQRTGDPAGFLTTVRRFFTNPENRSPTAGLATAVPAAPTRSVAPSLVVLADEHVLRSDELEAFGPHTNLAKGVGTMADLFTLLRANRPSLVIFGADFQDGTVAEACRFIRANPALKRVSILFVGENGDDLRARAAEAAGANACLLRPVRPEMMRLTMEKLLEVATRRGARFLVRLRADAADPGAGRFAYCQDISVTGMRLETHDPLAVGESLHVSFFMPDGRTEVACAAEIVRFHDRLGDRRSYGLKLVDLLPGYRQAIARFVQQAGAGAVYG